MPRRVASDQDHIERELLLDRSFAAEYLNTALQDDDPDIFLVALRRVAEAYGMSRVAGGARVERESLYRMLKPGGNPTYRNLWRVLRTVGLQLGTEEPRSTRSPSPFETQRPETTPRPTGHSGTLALFVPPTKKPPTTSWNALRSKSGSMQNAEQRQR